MIAYDKDIPAKIDGADVAGGEAVPSGGSSCSGSGVHQDMKPTLHGPRKYLHTFVNNALLHRARHRHGHKVYYGKDWYVYLVLFFTLLALVTGIWAVCAPAWLWDEPTNTSVGLWNTCTRAVDHVTVNKTIYNVTYNPVIERTVVNNTKNETEHWSETSALGCNTQEFHQVRMVDVPESRISSIRAAQGLICTALCLFFLSMVTIIAAFSVVNQHNLDSVRNWYIVSIMIQIVAFWLVLIGVFLYIFTERLLNGVFCMFVYFLIAFFAGIIAFFAIEFKHFKVRQSAVPVHCTS